MLDLEIKAKISGEDQIDISWHANGRFTKHELDILLLSIISKLLRLWENNNVGLRLEDGDLSIGGMR